MSEGSLQAGAEQSVSWDASGSTSQSDPVTGLAWRSQAACRSTAPELFFPVGATGTALVEIAAAKFVCSQCEVREPCLEFALVTHQEYGVWGGASEEERRILRRRRRQAGRAATTAHGAPDDVS